MPKVVKKSLSRARARNGHKPRAHEQRVRRPDGQVVRLVALDLHSKTFDDDLMNVFQRNIARERRENKRLFGSPDGPPTKG